MISLAETYDPHQGGAGYLVNIGWALCTRNLFGKGHSVRDSTEYFAKIKGQFLVLSTGLWWNKGHQKQLQILAVIATKMSELLLIWAHFIS